LEQHARWGIEHEFGERMIKLYFENGAPDHSITLGPAPWFRIAGNFIRQGPHGTIMGTFRLHHWEVNSHLFARYDCEGPVLVHFEDVHGGQTENFGPFSRLFAQDGVLHVGEKELFAKFIEETQMWHVFPVETYWPVMVIEAGKT
jgi:hypothetical protein